MKSCAILYCVIQAGDKKGSSSSKKKLNCYSSKIYISTTSKYYIVQYETSIWISRQQYIVVRESAFSAARVLAFSASCAGLMSYSFYYYVSKMRRNIDAHYEGLHLIFVLLLYIYNRLITYYLIQPTLFTNQRFMLDEMFWQRHFKICHTFWNMKTHLILCYTTLCL